MATLNVYFRDIPCARMTEGPGGALEFQYLESWIEEQAFAVSTRLPVGPNPFAHERVAPFAASFLPEGKSLRERLEKLIHVDADNDFRLLSVIGRECAGALSFWPEEEEPFRKSPGYDRLTGDEFDHWREYAHQLPLKFPGRDLRMSLAGVQSKAALYFDRHDEPCFPEHGAPTTHILKPRVPDLRPSTVFVELLTMRIAQSVMRADRVPASDLWRKCYRIRRFDRPRTKEGVIRLHQEDFCLALGRMPDQKYEMESPRESLLAPCFQLIDELGERGLIKSPALERLALLEQVIINVLLHNADAHLKNYAFVYQEDGTLEVSPLYDCLCTYDLRFKASETTAWEQSTGPAAHSRALSMRVGGAVLIGEVGRSDWEAFAIECGFTPAFVRRRVRLLAEQVREVVRPAADAVVETAPAAAQAAAGVVEGVLRQVEAALK